MTTRQAVMNSSQVSGRAVLVEPNQDVDDIIRCITRYHKKHAALYDKFAHRFDVGTERDIAKALYDFCKKHIGYEIQSEERQTVRTPARILAEGYGDCKHYASFIAGVLDSLKRSGLDIDWAYRFAKYENALTGRVSNHVFVVLFTPEGKEIWIDPVLDWFDYHLPYKSAITRRIDTVPKKAAGIGCAIGCGCSMGEAGQDMANYLKQYEQNLYTSVQQLTGSNQVTPGAIDILQGAAASLVPGAAQALAAAKGVQGLISSTFGVGSDFARISNALLSLNFGALFDAFKGRTYNTDQYNAVSDYSYHVNGILKHGNNTVADSEVAPALMWFIRKLGIYISGREHLEALRKSVDDYLRLYQVNKNTTQDRVRVQLARDVLLKYMPNTMDPGAWARTVGVYDNPVTAAIERLRLQDPNATTDTQGVVKTGTGTSTASLSSGISMGPLLILVGAGLFLMSSKHR